jgi:membrane protein DedA with SNARE-associated domain
VEVFLEYLSGNTSIIIYILLFALLMLCGVGLPLPEDIPLVAVGYLAYAGEINLIIGIVVSLIGILIGDTIIYYLGSKFGYDIARYKILRRVFTRKRLRRSERFFQKHGAKAVFFGRFVAGVRAATFFISGMMKLRYSVFITLDSLAALLSVPLFILIGFYFGENLDHLGKILNTVKHSVTLGAILIILLFILYYMRSANGNGNGEHEKTEKEKETTTA